MRKRRALAIGVLAGSLALAAAGCNRGGPGSTLPVAAADTAPACPGTWGADWRRLANKVHAPVFCPSWLPKPLNGRFAGSPFNSRAIGRDRSYLISYAWVDTSSPGGVNEVHVIPGATRVARAFRPATPLSRLRARRSTRPFPASTTRKAQSASAAR